MFHGQMAGAPFVVSDRYPPPPIDIVRLRITFFRIRTCSMADEAPITINVFPSGVVQTGKEATQIASNP
jgi:hypothetical protein